MSKPGAERDNDDQDNPLSPPADVDDRSCSTGNIGPSPSTSDEDGNQMSNESENSRAQFREQLGDLLRNHPLDMSDYDVRSIFSGFYNESDGDNDEHSNSPAGSHDS